MPARNKKSVLRSLRIPHELDEKIAAIRVIQSGSYSGCVVELVRSAIKSQTENNRSAEERTADSVLQWAKGKGRQTP
ncbi:hypothetical protein [Salmonella enterica]|uniref:Arc family DNA-binding protein n=2 Tax=Salmonella enterica TaxID=28901 RepID=A0A5Y5AVL4_SALER|nr:hypothetical protein [Salmonella enterica]EAZ7579929.1 hypothetical protein [Salmonella enterica subsp. enterica serovar Muenchen]EBF7359534.1 hypothetical protein [Salmonella enterica subsp. enterica serovar Edinburgh]EBH8640620.1 hypothetical protein [Salmonella enterica subsp. enterica serovar Thompson]EBH8903775.1 hypothetical protein [Salmonella enterica subsp. enterica serovar 6,7:b:-]EBH8908867.1 hypothetical protein [Salmonella enterica subsp. enterica serovar Santiago]ECI4630773.1